MARKLTEVFSLQMSAEMNEQLRDAAYHERCTRGELTRRALEAYMKPAPTKSRRVVRKSAVKGRK